MWQAAIVAAAPSAAERETARSLMEEADRQIARGDTRGALASYQAAHAIMHVPTTGLDLARTLASLGSLVEARAVAIEVINMPVARNEPPVFGEARQRASELAGQLESRVPSVLVKVTPAEGPHTVSIDGTRLPNAARAVAFRTNPGPHTVLVELAGVPPQQQTVTLDEGQAAVVAFELPSAVVAEYQPPPAPNGPDAPPVPGDAVAPSPIDEDPARAGRIRSIVGFSLGGVAVVAGAVTGVMSLLQVSDLKERCPNDRCSASDKDALDHAIFLGNVSNVTLPIGVLGVAWGVYELLTLPTAPTQPRAASRLRFELTGTGAVLHGTL